ncbi:hypothetical protein LMG19089_00976 [Ralstonia edaphis]|uniref:DUF2946 family protein n=1 Tax=Ralstonia edaphi TaxID=3058599 RepID=A0AB72WZU0_9RALS|nr:MULTISPECIES: DUF2946 family protein [unclassified Ralstonia]TXD61896.1 DUF2946 family protein [Ralstonia sp. TCR112]CAJ0692283.1 hypothetical protein LMG19089_00976 [Ralstonia sp. LMG 6871]CAJ0740537.1 hypothetical protein R16034_02183 [Ralstonia sp. LMG 6871]
MDDIVRQAMAKWPNVPNCFGWLALDRRGQWRMRNEYAQANKLSGEPIRHTALIDFIVRNYAHDDAGRWFFQNGPQRVFVELDYTPWVARLSAGGTPPAFTTTTGAAFSPTGCFVDEQGSVLLSGRVAGFEAEETIALLHDHDLEPFSSLANWHGEACGAALGTLTLGDRTFDIEPIARTEVAKRYGFVAQPAE